MGDKKDDYFYEILSVRKQKRTKNYHYDIIQQQNDVFNKSFPFSESKFSHQ